jgi:hypothetical protein
MQQLHDDVALRLFRCLGDVARLLSLAPWLQPQPRHPSYT